MDEKDSGLAGTIQLNHECTRIDTNGTDFGGAYPNQSPSGEPGGFPPNLFHYLDIRVHSCQFVVSVCMIPDWQSTGPVNGSTPPARKSVSY
jgi:hypothetical protein